MAGIDFVKRIEFLLQVTVYEGIGFEGATTGVIFGEVDPITGLSGGHPLSEPLEPL